MLIEKSLFEYFKQAETQDDKNKYREKLFNKLEKLSYKNKIEIKNGSIAKQMVKKTIIFLPQFLI